jgi:hypothetical protein
MVNSTSIEFNLRTQEHTTLPSNTISRSFSPPMNVQTLQQHTDLQSIYLSPRLRKRSINLSCDAEKLVESMDFIFAFSDLTITVTLHRWNPVPALQPVDATAASNIRALGRFAGARVAVAGYGCGNGALARIHALLSHITLERREKDQGKRLGEMQRVYEEV